ncbi:hypothetical protein [Actinoallomurus iriomotensis]|uniref:Uncharacterized protein n=1 Tax=Actinoallomurus iriomotensis TaxID=478107 RepID=A0A9W6RFH4_9ACTN|nr:hypothetical protein [Actinoallomurus iriomotensis]GLY74884.1 hypothetical protein Airi01_031510 [Actinoallomurus iriomotensis]
MNDVRSLLSEAVPPDLRTSYPWPDAEPDIARGRALLMRRRRRVALAGGTGVVAAGVAGALLLTGVPAGHSHEAASPAASVGRSVALVAYEGAQPKGYTLRTIPQGWEVASADDLSLILHRAGTPTGGTYEDKIVVQGDLNPFPKSGDQAVEVNGHRGWFFGHKGPGYSVTLIFQTDQRGRPAPGLSEVPLNVMVQLPHSLNWNVTTMVKFASGITVAKGARGAVG